MDESQQRNDKEKERKAQEAATIIIDLSLFVTIGGQTNHWEYRWS